MCIPNDTRCLNALQMMREAYKTVKGLGSVDFASMARQLAAELRVTFVSSASLLTYWL